MLTQTSSSHALRGRVLSFTDDGHVYHADGLVSIRHGHIAAVGAACDLLPGLAPGSKITDHGGHLILPGLIDTHIHYPQTRVIASHGTQLLEWLQKYTFVEEQKLRDPAYAGQVARFFLDELFRNGTTTAAVYCTVHPQSVTAFFSEAEGRGARMIAGKVMMDRGAPTGLLDTAQSGYDDSRALLLAWHGRGRLGYAITPRFAITSTAAQLDAAGALALEFPDVHVQTHLCETLAEIALAKSLHPDAASYTDIYRRHGLLGPRSILGHCIHLQAAEVDMLATSGSVAAFCPTSNLFLGSGLFDMARLKAAGVRIGLATDIGGGTSYSMLRTAAEAYKVLQMQGQTLPALEAFRMMTRGNAGVLGLADRIGSLQAGMEADIVVLDASATPAMAQRMAAVRDDLAEELFVLMTLGDDRSVRATYVAGQRIPRPPFMGEGRPEGPR